MNAKSAMKSFLYRAPGFFLIAMMLIAGLTANPVYATTVTYNFQTDTGTIVATSIVTNDAACGTNPTVATTTLMSTAAFGCAVHIIRPTTSGAQNILDIWFNTAYASDTVVTGTSLKIRLREASGAGTTPWTAGIRLMYVNASGTITNFTGTEVTQVVNDGSDANYTLSLTGQTATVPAGSKLGIRIRATDGTSTNMRVYYGSAASTIAGTSGVLILNEKQTTTLTVAAATGIYNGTTELSATLTNSAGLPISGKTISFTLNGSSVGSAITDASGVASLSGISLTGINAGNYPTGVAASFAGDIDYVTSNGTNSLTLDKATPTLSVTNSPVIYRGSAQAATVVGSVDGVVSDIQYDGSSTVPTNAGTYVVTADFVPTDTTNYNNLTDAAAGDFVIDKATPTLSVTNSPVIYNGSPQAATVVGSVDGLVSNIQYDGSPTIPTNIGTYVVTADFVPTDTINYNSLTDAPAGDFVIDKATPTLSVTNSPVTYNGSPQPATVVGSVPGVVSNIQYDGSMTVPTNAGTYLITADFVPTDTTNYNSLTDASAGDFVIDKATPTLSVTNSPVTYNGSPQAATVVGSVDGVVSDIQYDGSATVPTNAGTYVVTADFVPTDTTNYNSLTDASAGDFVIDKATPTLSITNSPVVYNGSPQAATVVGSVDGVVSDIKYDGSATVPTNAGTYVVTADFVPTDTTNYNSLMDASAGDFVIDKATPTLSVTNSPVTYSGSTQAATVVGSVDGVVSNIQYDGSTTVPTNAGTYVVTADFVPTDTINYNSLTDAAAGDFVIAKATPTLSVTNSPVVYNGSPQAAVVAGSVAGVVSDIQYNGFSTIPTNIGTYAVTADFVPTDTTNYNSLTNVSAGDFTIHAGPAQVEVSIAGNPVGSHNIPPLSNLRPSYPGVNSGPVVVESTNGIPIVAALRDAWMDGGPITSSIQLMGLPQNQLSDTYWFPAYNNVSLDDQLRFGNVGTSPTTVTVTIGGILRGTYTNLQPNQGIRVNYPGLDSGPVKVQSSGGVKIIASIRDSWNDGTKWSSYAQLMGLPNSQLSDTYLFPAYNNVSLDDQLRFGNVGTAPTDVTVTIGGIPRGTYHLNPNQSVRVNYPGLDSGPVKVQSSGGVKIIASIRDAWHDGTKWTSYAQLMGLPLSQLSDTYYFPAYDNVSLDGQLRFGNVGTAPTTVTVTINGVVKGTYNLNPNQSVRVNYAGLDSGPVKIQSSGGVKIIASLRDAWFDGTSWTSYSQLMGLPGGQLTTSYYFPAYNNVTYDNQLRIGVP